MSFKAFRPAGRIFRENTEEGKMDYLKRDGFDLSWIHYTHLEKWYMKLGYEPVLHWNCKGFL